jgi:hypothetical protein
MRCCRAVSIAVMLCRYVTEGQFRASHPAEPERPDADDARSAATLPGAARAMAQVMDTVRSESGIRATDCQASLHNSCTVSTGVMCHCTCSERGVVALTV